MIEKEIHIRDYLRILRKRRFAILTFFCVTLAVVLIVTFTRTPIYEASTQILVEKNESAPLLENVNYWRRDPEFYSTQAQLIQSLNVVRRVESLLSRDKVFIDYFSREKEESQLSLLIKKIIDGPKKLYAKIVKQSNSYPDTQKSKADLIAQAIKSNVIITPVKESKLLNISYQAEDPELAMLIANTIASAYTEELMAIQLNSSGHTIKWMTQKAEEEKAKLAKSEKALQEFMKEQDIVTIEDRITIIPQKLTDYTARLAEAETERKDLENVCRQIVKQQKGGGSLETIPAIANDKPLQSLLDQILGTEKQVLELSQKYGEKHPVMAKARGELRSLNEKKRQEIKKIIKSIQNSYELAKSKEIETKNSLAKVKKEAMNLNEKFIQYGILKREVETNKALYQALNMQMKEKGVTGDTQNANVWITEPAELPESPIKPKKVLNILFGIFAGAFGGIGLALFLEYLDNTIKEPEEVEAKVGQPVIGVVPDFAPAWGKNVELALYRKRFSPFAECIKSLRSSILLSSADSPPRSLLITSMTPQEGKSTIALNLAVAIAQADYNVLVVDADMRKPRIHKILGLRNLRGLSSFLAGSPNSKIIRRITESDLNIIPSGPTKPLHIIPSGPTPPNPSELLVSEKLKEVVALSKRKFDFVIFDSPPLLGATDSLILSKIVDGTIIVSRANLTTYEIINQGLKSLTDIKANILGMVINGVNIKESRYYGYYGYYNQDGSC